MESKLVNLTLQMIYKLRVEESSDGWVVKSDQFKSLAYGATPEEARKSFDDAVGEAIRHFEDRSSLIRYLEETGIQWWLEPSEDVGGVERTAYQELEE